MRRLPLAPRLAAAATVAAVLAAGAPPAALAQSATFSDLQHGKALVTAGDCSACHTAEGGKPFAGGRPVETPFGTIYSTNITPDPQTGIGAWTSEQFYRAMHHGIRPDGKNLYPAFPYPWFTKVKRDDVDAILAYLKSLPPVRQTAPKNKLIWPLDNRLMVAAWNKLYLEPGTFQPDPKQSAEWNRGAYLVQGLGHCGACHSPKNVLGAAKDNRQFEGATNAHWYAPNLNGDKQTGLGGWSQDDIFQFLKTGHDSQTVAYGPMAQVVADSTSKMPDADLRSIAVYLKSLPPSKNGQSNPAAPDAKLANAGAAIYRDNCSACHGMDGSGVKGMFPRLTDDSNLQAQNPETAIRLVLNGGKAAAVPGAPTAVGMPPFGWKLSDQEVAAVLSYLRSNMGNSAPPVSAGKVHSVRQAVESTGERY